MKSFTAVLRILLVSSFALLGSTVVAVAQVQQEWAARYNDAYNGRDGAYCMAVDKAGNIYIGGFAESSNAPIRGFPHTDFLTVKYDSHGKEVWAAHFEGYRTNRNEAYGIGVDTNGNVYVTGTVLAGDNNYSDIGTVKYDSDGHQLWVSYYAGPWEDTPYALVLDDAANVYVTGITYDFENLYDVVTIKYDSDGHELWTAVYNGPSSRDDYGEAMTLDAEGNVAHPVESTGNLRICCS